MVTFETKCYENDYRNVLTGDRLQTAIKNCGHAFEKRVVIINNIRQRSVVEELAKQQVNKGVIDAYYFVDDYAEQALQHFRLTKEDFAGGYYYSIAELVGLFVCTTPYLLHFSSDAMIMTPATTDWVSDAIRHMEQDHTYICANPFWSDRAPKLEDGFSSQTGAWMIGNGFSDQCYLVPTKIFRQPIYSERHDESDHYPKYGGELFEKRVDSYMRNHRAVRLTSTEVRYLHKNFPPKGLTPRLNTVTHAIGRRFGSLLKKSRARTIKEAKGTRKVYDIFTFFNELELLEIRLNVLNDVVDYFVIVECTETFSGQPKPLTYLENKERFKQFAHKIIHYVVNDTPKDKTELRERLARTDLSQLDRETIQFALTSDNVAGDVLHWFKEFYQKESIKKALVGLQDNDICFVSDVDEIWNPDVRIDLTKDVVYKLRQVVYGYYLNNRSNEPWAGTLVTTYRNIKHACLNHLRTASKTPYTYVKNGGWHFTNQGGAERIKEKLEASYGPEDYNTDDIKSKISERMNKNVDYIGRGFTYRIDESSLPHYILDHRNLYQRLLK